MREIMALEGSQGPILGFQVEVLKPFEDVVFLLGSRNDQLVYVANSLDIW